jgi:hypothetical protein
MRAEMNAGSSSKPMLVLEPAIPTCPTIDEMDAARQSQLFTLLDHPRHAIALTCLDAYRLKLVCSGGGLRVFRHRCRPTVFAHVMGRIVGIEEREKRVAWLGTLDAC